MTESTDYKLRTLVSSDGKGFYRIVLEGTGSIREIYEATIEIAVFPDTEKELWVISKLRLHMTPTEVSGLAETVKSNPNRPSRVAIVADNDLLYGLSRIFSGHREDDHTAVAVFRDTEAALQWLDVDMTLPAPEEARASAWHHSPTG